MNTDEEFGHELLSTLLRRAETLQQSIGRPPREVPYPSHARNRLIEFLLELNGAIIQRLNELRAGPPQPCYTAIETPAKRLGIVLNLLSELFEFIVHSETHRIPSPLIAPFEAMVRRFFVDALLLVRYIWGYNYNYENIGQFLKDSSQYSGLNLTTSPPEHFIMIGFPTTERENVLLHSVFAHELGHFLTQARQLDNSIPVTIDPGLSQALPPQQRAQLLDVTLRWYSEIFSDVFGIYLLGPAYFHAFSEIGLQALHTPGPRHPPPHFRLTWMLTLLRRLSYLDEKDQTVTIVESGRLDAKSKEYLEKWTEFLTANPLAPLGPFYACVMQGIPQILDRIETEVRAVIGGNGYTADRFKAEVNPLVDRILRLVPPSEGDNVLVPNFVSILNAGWVVRTTRFNDLLDLLSMSQQEDKGTVHKILNDLLYKSLEYLVIKKVWETPI